jgi:predicted TIM-barrel fold metal-dependent hydrolase
MLTRRQVIASAAAAGVTTFFRSNLNLLAEAPQPATALNFQPPAGCTDTHRHIFGDLAKYPYAATSGYRHEPAWVDDMRKLDRTMHIDRRVLIQPSGYGTDNSALLDGLKAFGVKQCRAVVAIDDKTPDTSLDEWHKAGVRGVRASLGQTPQDAKVRLAALASRLKGRPWHINTAISKIDALDGLQDVFATAAVPIVIDHYAGATAAGGPSQPGFDVLLKLLKSGNVYVKMSRLHNVSKEAPGYADVEPLAKAILAASHDRLLWGTDWPHAGIRPEGYSRTDISPYFKYDDGLIFNEFAAWVGSPTVLKTILVDNPARLYGF